MSRQFKIFCAAIVVAAQALTGCSPTQHFYFLDDKETQHYISEATKIEYPDVDNCTLADVRDAQAPLTLDNMHYDSMWDLSLEEAVRYSLQNAKIMRTLGGRFASTGGPTPQVGEAPDFLLTNPAAVQTVFDPGIVESAPQGGVEAALAEFDAQLTGSLDYQHNDHPQNVNANLINSQLFKQDLVTSQWGIQKRGAAGTVVSFNTTTVYNDNNQPSRQTAHDYTTNFEAAVRQPLLAGGGVQYNRIAGPFDPFVAGGTAAFDGVVLARINTDISLAQFEAGVRNLVSDVENAYWELYFAYRDLESRKKGRDSALETWRKVNAQFEAGLREADAQKEAQSREQYFSFRAEVETALANLYKAENRLRYIMGLAATDGRLIRPKDEPTTAKVSFDWNELHCEGLVRSVEIREQKWRVKQREMELIAARNLLLPHLDLLARYRRVGQGEMLFGDGNNNFNQVQGVGALDSLANGNFNEYELGLQFTQTIGIRKELATVRNEQMLLAREKARLQDQELELSHAMSDAIRDLSTHFQVTQTQFNRRVAAERQVEAVKAAYDAGTVTLDLLLEAQRNRADAETAYYRSLVDYNRGIARVHFRKGSLLEYNGVYLAEGPWPAKAYFDATKRARERDAAKYIDYGYTRPNVFSRGPVEQFQGEGMPLQAPGAGPTEAAPAEEIKPGKMQPDNQGPNAGKTTARLRASGNASVQSTGNGRKRNVEKADDGDEFKANTAAMQRTTSVVRQAQHVEVAADEQHESDADQPAPETHRAATGWTRAKH